MDHIPETERGKEMATHTPTPRQIRRKSSLTQITKDEPDTEPWLNQDYADQAIDREIRNLSRRKALGNDGIPGESYTATRQWAIKHIAKITNLVNK